MQPRVYLETSIISYLTARPSRDLVIAANQQLTREWWNHCRSNYELFVSQVVIEEASRGDASAAADRLQAIEGLAILDVTEDAERLAQRLVDQGPVPQKAVVDALHIAVAVVGGVDFLVTWNCTHIANAAIRRQIDDLCRDAGYEPPIICTPPELLGTNDEG